MKAIIKEIITHFLVICISLIVAYGNHDDQAYKVSDEVNNLLVVGDSDKTSFSTLTWRGSFLPWAKSSLIPSLFPTDTPEEYPYVGIIKSGDVSNVLGVGRIRQLRIKKDTCKVPEVFISTIPDCNEFYSLSQEETKDFGQGWSNQEQRNLTFNDKSIAEPILSPWHYLEDSRFLYMGKISSYQGGGYVVELGPDDFSAIQKLKNLESSGWIDRYTRALFTELSLYNVNVNLLCVATLLFEDLPTGNGQIFVNIQTIKVFRYIGNFSAALLTCEVIFSFLLMRWIVRDGKRLWKERKAFWKNVWNIADIAITVLSLTALILYFMRMGFLQLAINEFRQDRTKFVSFQYVVLLNEGVNVMLAFAVLLLNLKFLRLLKFNRKICVLISALKSSAFKVASFMVMFLVIFLAYCFLVWLVFGTALKDYRSIVRCMVSMMAMVLGNFQYYDLVDVHRIIGPAVFFSFMVIFQFIIMNMFIGILCDSFEEVRADAVKQSNEYEILEFMTNRVKAFLGLFVEPPIRPEYTWPKSELEKTVQTIEEKAEASMYFMRNLCAEDARDMKWFEPDKWSPKKSKVVSLVLQSDNEILENDLYDGTVVMNTLIHKYSENELDRMLLASRIRQPSSLSSEIRSHNYNNESDDVDSDDEISESSNNMTVDSTEQNVVQYTKEEMEKEEALNNDDTMYKEEQIGEELKQEIEEGFGDECDDDEDKDVEEIKDNAEKCNHMESAPGKEETSSFPGKTSCPSPRRSTCTISPSPSTASLTMPQRRSWQNSTGDSRVNADCFENEGCETGLGHTATPPASATSERPLTKLELSSVEGLVSSSRPSSVQLGEPITIFMKEAENDSFPRPKSSSKD